MPFTPSLARNGHVLALLFGGVRSLFLNVIWRRSKKYQTVETAVSTPRSLDLAHLRTAMWFHAREPLRRFVTLDEAQADAARELGLPV